MKDNALISHDELIKKRIFTVRDVQIMLDSDLAELYNVETKQINRAVNRNKDRFPDNFCFQLTETEYAPLRFQSGTLNEGDLEPQPGISNMRGKHRKYLPYAFTEQGVSMLSSVLRSKTAVEVSIKIMNAFIAMRRFISKNAEIFYRLDSVEKRQIEFEIKTDKNFEKMFDAMEPGKPKQGIFFNGQIFDAYAFLSDLVRSAKKSIKLIDNYVDDSVLVLFGKRGKGIKVTIFTKEINKQLSLDLLKYNSQYPLIEIKEFRQSHDRFMIIDNKDVYHFGASLKDLGKKWFAFSKFDKGAAEMLERLK